MQNGTSSILIVGYLAKRAVELNRYLSKHYEINIVDTAEDGLAYLDGTEVDLVLCRHDLPEFDGLEFLKQLRVRHPEIIRLIAGSSSKAEIELAINDSAVYQFVHDDWSVAQIELLVRRALENKELSYRHRHLSRDLKIAEDILLNQRPNSLGQNAKQTFDSLVYSSASMARMCNVAMKAAKTNLPILIQGETGTGKELIARAIHANSDRNEQPLLVHNCGGMSDEMLQSELFGHVKGSFTGAVSDRLGLLPAADGGTVFLDEIANVSPLFQVSLLRFLQEGEIKPLGSDKIIKCNVRVIAASNKPIEKLIENGLFRKDLYYRLNGFQLNIPPLRKRPEDIEITTNFLAHRIAGEINKNILGVSPAAIEKFMLHDWPGNVRELENEVKRMVALTDDRAYVTEENISESLIRLKPKSKSQSLQLELNGHTLKQKVEHLEAELIAQTLRHQRWNKSKAAEDLGISRVGLANKIKRYGLIEAEIVTP